MAAKKKTAKRRLTKPATAAEQRSYLLGLEVATAEQRLRQAINQATKAELDAIYSHYRVQVARAQIRAMTEAADAEELPDINATTNDKPN